MSGRSTKYASVDCQKKMTKDAHLRKTYDITLEQFNQILEFQNGVCAICGKKPKNGVFNVDHDHNEPFTVRGLCCYMCNKIILGSRTKDAIERLYRYVMNPPAVSVLGVVSAPVKGKRQGSSRRRKSPTRKASRGAKGKLKD